jgi:hypothetical protein
MGSSVGRPTNAGKPAGSFNPPNDLLWTVVVKKFQFTAIVIEPDPPGILYKTKN